MCVCVCEIYRYNFMFLGGGVVEIQNYGTEWTKFL